MVDWELPRGVQRSDESDQGLHEVDACLHIALDLRLARALVTTVLISACWAMLTSSITLERSVKCSRGSHPDSSPVRLHPPVHQAEPAHNS